MGNVPSTSTSQLYDIPKDQLENYEDFEEDELRVLDLSCLFDAMGLSMAVSKHSEAFQATILSSNCQTLIGWLKHVMRRNADGFISQSQFCNFLNSQTNETMDLCAQAFRQFDIEGQGVVDARAMRKALKKSLNGSFRSDLEALNRYLLLCNNLPGLFDVFDDEKRDVNKQATCILMFILRNRPNAAALQVPMLSSFSERVELRSQGLRSLIKSHAQSEIRRNLLKLEDANAAENAASFTEEFALCSSIVKEFDVSSNKAQASRLFNGDCWESTSDAGPPHWIRFAVKSDVRIRELSIGVKEIDQSYSPQHVIILAGNSVDSLTKISEVHVPRSLTGNLVILRDAKRHFPWIQISIAKCYDGSNTRINGLKILGYKVVASSSLSSTSLSVMDSLAIWYLQIMSASLSSSFPSSPQLRSTVLQQSRALFENLKPLSLSPSSKGRPALLTANILDEIDSFLTKLITEPEVLIDSAVVLLQLNLSRGHVSKLVKNLLAIKESGREELQVGNLIGVMSETRDALWKLPGRALEVEVAGCDGDAKKSVAAAVGILSTPPGAAYMTEDGRTQANIFFKAADYLQLSKLRIQVQKGAEGARCGLVFVYSHAGAFDLNEHVKMFEKYDTWRQNEYVTFSSTRTRKPTSLNRTEDEPVAFFSFDDLWDEIEVNVDVNAIGQYVLVKFLESRQPTSERLGISSIKLYGFVRKFSLLKEILPQRVKKIKRNDGVVSTRVVCRKVLQFLCDVLLSQHAASGKYGKKDANSIVDLSDISVGIFWQAYKAFKESKWPCCSEVLHLFYMLLPRLALSEDTCQNDVKECFEELSKIVDDVDVHAEVEHRNMVTIAGKILADGAAVFFSDKDLRKQLMLKMMKTTAKAKDLRPSSALQFKSLCKFYNTEDPNGLLGLPSDTDTFDVSPTLSVMNLLLSTCQGTDESLTSGDVEPAQNMKDLVDLLSTLQSTLMIWCSNQTIVDSKEISLIAQNLVVQYVELFTSVVASSVCQFASLSDELLKNFVLPADGHILVSTFPQFVVLVTLLADKLNLTSKMKVIHAIKDVVKQIGVLSSKLPTLFDGVESEKWSELSESCGELRAWEVESLHPYECNLNVTQVFCCPGATSFVIDFDPQCCTESNYDYLEFTDSSGEKRRFDGTIGSDSWPLSVTIKANRQLQFLFHSDPSTCYWGYKFKLSARGSLSEPLNSLYEAYLGACKLLGKLCGSNLDVSPVLTSSAPSSAKGVTKAEILNTELWTTIFRGGYSTGRLQRSISGKLATEGESTACKFLYALTEEEDDDVMRFIAKVRERQTVKGVGHSQNNADIDEVIIAVFADLIWHTQSLREEINAYGILDVFDSSSVRRMSDQI